jgi:hypothetical protein
LIDNSIAAQCKEIDICLHWAGADSWCAVMDDGRGMTESHLRQAMRIGAWDPVGERDRDDLGRFGLGLKTASFSQCRELTVATKTHPAELPQIRSWDLDHVRAVGRWELRRSASKAAAEILADLRQASSGTIVLWRRLTELTHQAATVDDPNARRHFIEHITRIDDHIAMIFGRFITRRPLPIQIRVNDRRVEAWDPFLQNSTFTQRLPSENLQVNGQKVTVSPFVLPHKSKLSEQEYRIAGGPGGWNAQQGFYVYRNDRLIIAGGWLGLGFTQGDAYNLARIAIDVPATLDYQWHLDVTKGTVRPPAVLRNDLKRIAKETRSRARLVLQSRGGLVGRNPKKAVVTVWEQRRRHGELIFHLNRQHPLIAELLERDVPNRSQIAAVLDLIEQAIPTPVLPAAPPSERRAFEGAPPDVVVELATHLYENLLRRGMSRMEAAYRVLNTEPFNEYPELVKTIWNPHE